DEHAERHGQQVAAADELVAGLVDGDDLAAGDELGQAAPGHHEDQRGDDRLDADRRDQEPVPGAEQHGQPQRQHHGHQHALLLVDEQAGERPGDGHDRADRQIDAAGRDDQRHAQRHQDQRRAEPQEGDEAPAPVAPAELDGEEAGREDQVDQQQQGQSEDRPEQTAHQVRPPLAMVSMITSLVRSSSLGSSAIRRRSRSTATLWLSRSTSSSSAEMNSTATPPPDSSATSRWIPVFAPTSMPRVGSSRMSSRGSRISQRASSTFCWLPPLRLRTGISGSGGLIRSALTYLPTSSSCCSRGTGLAQPRVACKARMMFSRTVRSSMRPSRLRFSEQNAILWFIAARGVRSETGSPLMAICPPPAWSAPNSSRATSVRPDP